MMLFGKNKTIKIYMVVLLSVSFLFLACCDKQNNEPQKSTTKKETKQQTAETSENKIEKTNTESIEKEITSTQKIEVITTITHNGGDNEIIFDASEETESINISSTKSSAISTTEASEKYEYTTNAPASQKPQKVTEPATDSDGWVTKWY